MHQEWTLIQTVDLDSNDGNVDASVVANVPLCCRTLSGEYMGTLCAVLYEPKTAPKK